MVFIVSGLILKYIGQLELHLSPPQSPLFFIKEFGNEREYEMVKHGNEREAGAYGKEKSETGAYGRLMYRALQFRASDWGRGRNSIAHTPVDTPVWDVWLYFPLMPFTSKIISKILYQSINQCKQINETSSKIIS